MIETWPERTGELRRSFDQAFALPRRQVRDEVEQFLAIRVGGQPCALRLRDLTGLAAGRRVLSLPSRAPELLGIAGVRGALVPVYSLAVLLGHGQATAPLRWLAQCGGEDPIGLAFEEFEGYLRAPRADVYRANTAAGRHVSEVVRVGAVVRALVDVPSLTAALKARGHPGPSKER